MMQMIGTNELMVMLLLVLVELLRFFLCVVVSIYRNLFVILDLNTIGIKLVVCSLCVLARITLKYVHKINYKFILNNIYVYI